PIADVLTLDERIDNAVARPRFNAGLLVLFASVALLLAVLGVYGVLSYSVAARLREIGVRLALGATSRRILDAVLGEGLRFASLGIAIGSLGAVGAGRIVRGLDAF